jgi:hypothetical protein
MTPVSAAVGAQSSLLVVSLFVGVVAAFLGYGVAKRFEARTGSAAWRLPAGAWAFIFFLFRLIGLLLFLIARVTTRPRRDRGQGPDRWPPNDDVGPVEPAPMAGWYPDPSGRHELRYWDGKGWTSHVRDGASQSTDAG